MRQLLLLTLTALSIFSCQDQPKPSLAEDDKLAEKLYPYEQFYVNRNFPDKEVDVRAIAQAKASVKQARQSGARSEGKWISQGPGNIGARVNTIAVNPSNDNEMVMGFSSGGIFKTVDNGQNWSPIFDEQIDLNIGDITYDPNNSDIIYAGTGDPNISGYPKIGSGVFKTIDGGETWSYIGLQESSIVSRVHVAASNSDILYVSTMGIPFKKTNDRGVYKSTDGGATWEHVLFINDSTGVIDMVVHPEDPNIVYAAGWNRIRNDKESRIVGPDARIHKTTDGGETWTMLEGGLPIGESLGRIGLAMSGSNYDHIYAMYINTGGAEHCEGSGSQLMGIWDSEDAGSTWTEINTGEESGLPCGALGGFAWYFGQLRVNPNDDNDLFVLGVDMFRTTNKGLSWDRAVPAWQTYEVHADKHDLIFNNNEILLGTDGGAYRSTIDDSLVWVDIENIPTTQFYRTAYNPHTPDLYYGGAQDNGTSGGNGGNINQWRRIYGGDGFQMAFDQLDSNIMYASSQRGNLGVSFNGGLFFDSGNLGFDDEESSNWDSPYILSPQDNKVLYYGRESMYRGFNDGSFLEWEKISPKLIEHGDEVGDDFFQRTISAVSQSAINGSLIYAGTSDGRVWRSMDSGLNWDNISEGVPYRYISDIVPSATMENTVYVSVTGYKSDDFTPYIHRSDDNGDTWESISGNLPLISINEIYVLEENGADIIFVATDGGIFFTQDDGLNWDILGDNLPIIEVYDLDYNEVHNQLIAATFARGIQTFDLSQVGIGEPVSSVTNQEIDFNIFPNLTTGIVNIQTEEPINKIQVFDINARLMWDGHVQDGQIDISPLPDGMYIIHASSNKGQKAKRIIKHGLE